MEIKQETNLIKPLKIANSHIKENHAAGWDVKVENRRNNFESDIRGKFRVTHMICNIKVQVLFM